MDKTELLLSFTYAGCAWFCLLCMLWANYFIVGKKADYLLFMNIQGEQREDPEVKALVREYKKKYGFWTLMLFFATGGFFLCTLLPVAVDAAQIWFLTAWLFAMIVVDYEIIKTYANRMYELKLQKGWGNPPKQKTAEVDTIVSRMKKSMPVSELWFAFPLWICIGSFLWWFQSATEYKILLVLLLTNVLALLFFGYMYHRIAHGKLKVYSEDSDINYALNKTAKRAWSGCIVWEATLVCGYQFLMTVLSHSYMKEIAEQGGSLSGDHEFLLTISVISVILTALVGGAFFYAAGSVKRAKKEIAEQANFTYAEDEDAYWRNGYYYNPNDTNSFVESRTLGLTPNMATKWGAITKWILIGTLVFCIGTGAALLPFDFGNVSAKTEEDGIVLKACLYYNEKLMYDDVSAVFLLPERPEMSRVWGTGTSRFALGDYHFADYGNGKAMIDKDADYFILVKRQNGKWFGFSTQDEAEMLRYYEELKQYEKSSDF